MPAADDLRADTDALRTDSEFVRLVSEDLRALSRKILAELDVLHHLEAESRKVPVGSSEMQVISAEIAARAKRIFLMTDEQERLAKALPRQAHSLADLDEAVG